MSEEKEEIATNKQLESALPKYICVPRSDFDEIIQLKEENDEEIDNKDEVESPHTEITSASNQIEEQNVSGFDDSVNSSEENKEEIENIDYNKELESLQTEIASASKPCEEQTSTLILD